MAAADPDQDDEFDEYNPHPYLGGYDISSTYGDALPPSPNTCYPISSVPPQPSDDPPEPSIVPDDVSPTSIAPENVSPTSIVPENVSPPSIVPENVSPPSIVPQPEPDPSNSSSYIEPVYDYHYAYAEELNLFGFSPFASSDDGGEYSYWRPLRRAADYLFGYSQGCGERVIGTDRYGIPVYANKKHGSEQAISVQVEPAMNQTVNYFDGEGHQFHSDSWPTPYQERWRVNSSYYEKDYNAPPRIYEDPDQHVWSQACYADELYQEEKFFQSERDERSYYQSSTFACNVHHHEQSLTFQLEPYRPSWTQTLNSFDEYSLSIYNSADEGHFSENPTYDDYSIPYEQPHFDQLEPYAQSQPQVYGYNEAYDVRAALQDNSIVWDESYEDAMQLFSFPKYEDYSF